MGVGNLPLLVKIVKSYIFIIYTHKAEFFPLLLPWFPAMTDRHLLYVWLGNALYTSISIAVQKMIPCILSNENKRKMVGILIRLTAYCITCVPSCL